MRAEGQAPGREQRATVRNPPGGPIPPEKDVSRRPGRYRTPTTGLACHTRPGRVWRCILYTGYMTSEEVAWVAGVLEGEGCFDYNRTPKYPRVRLEMADGDVVERVHALVGCGRISEPTSRNPGRWRATKLLVINGRDNVEPLLVAIRPWLGERRGAKVDELLDTWRDGML